MPQQQYGFIYKTFVLNREFRSDEELGLHMKMLAANAFALLIHICLILIYSLAAVPFFIVYNVASCAVYSALFLLIHRKAYVASGLILSLEVMLYTAVSIHVVGLHSYVVMNLFIVLVLQFIILYAGLRLRVVVIALLLLLLNAALWYGNRTVPLLDLGPYLRVMAAFNLNITFVAVIIELSINNVVRNFIAHVSANRMEELEQQAYRDALTGLYNRRYADQYMQRLQQGAVVSERCVAMLDIDDFKLINDTYGHGVGDIVLQSLANTMRENLRKTDVVFRWGGEEFVIFLDSVDVATAQPILEKLRLSIMNTVIVAQDVQIHITATIGAVRYDVADAQGSIERADKKMYQGKLDGKNRTVI